MEKKKYIWDIFLKPVESLSKKEKDTIKDYYYQYSQKVILSKAEEQKMIPFVSSVLCSLNIDREFWKDYSEYYSKRNQAIIRMLDDVFGSFSTNKCISPCVTENFGSLLLSDYHIECFCSGDVDISSDISEKEKIDKTLVDMGFTLVKRKEYRNEIAQDEYKCPDHYIDNFYLNIVYQPVIREKAYTLDQRLVDSWLKTQRLSAVRYHGTMIKILEKEAMLIHCLYHISAGHYYTASPGTKLLVDIDRIIRFTNIDWNKIWTTSVRLKIEKRIELGLLLAEGVLETPNIKYGLYMPQKRQKKLLYKHLYRSIDGTMKEIEPSNNIERLYIDTFSDRGSIISASFHKAAYAVSWFISNNKN